MSTTTSPSTSSGTETFSDLLSGERVWSVDKGWQHGETVIIDTSNPSKFTTLPVPVSETNQSETPKAMGE